MIHVSHLPQTTVDQRGLEIQPETIKHIEEIMGKILQYQCLQ